MYSMWYVTIPLLGVSLKICHPYWMLDCITFTFSRVSQLVFLDVLILKTWCYNIARDSCEITKENVNRRMLVSRGDEIIRMLRCYPMTCIVVARIDAAFFAFVTVFITLFHILHLVLIHTRTHLPRICIRTYRWILCLRCSLSSVTMWLVVGLVSLVYQCSMLAAIVGC